MTKTEKKLVELCELIDAYFQMQQTVVRSAIESQLKEQTKEIVEEITNKKKKEPSLFDASKNEKDIKKQSDKKEKVA